MWNQSLAKAPPFSSPYHLLIEQPMHRHEPMSDCADGKADGTMYASWVRPMLGEAAGFFFTVTK